MTLPTRWIATSLVLALAAVQPAMSSPPRPSAAQTAQFDQGLQDGWTFDNRGNMAGSYLLSDQFWIMQEAGAGWVRIHFRLGECFSEWDAAGCRADGKTALQLNDEVVSAALSHNLKVLGLVTHETWRGNGGQEAEWSSNNVENGGTDGDNAYIRGLANRAGLLAAYFKDRINAWELWTKPNAWTDNSGTVYTGGTFVYPSNYAQMLRQTGGAIKSANAEATFISGGLLGHDVGVKHQGLQGTYKQATNCPNRLPSGGDYLCAVYDMGRAKAGWAPQASPFDHIGQQLYIKQDSAVTSADLLAYLDDLRNVYLTYGGEPASKQTHITAFGWTTATSGLTALSVSADLQAQNLETGYHTFREMSPSRGGYVARAYWFRTRDETRPEYSEYYGIVDPNAAPKPAFSAYQKHAW
jgi:hypothetical protein